MSSECRGHELRQVAGAADAPSQEVELRLGEARRISRLRGQALQHAQQPPAAGRRKASLPSVRGACRGQFQAQEALNPREQVARRVSLQDGPRRRPAGLRPHPRAFPEDPPAGSARRGPAHGRGTQECRPGLIVPRGSQGIAQPGEAGPKDSQVGPKSAGGALARAAAQQGECAAEAPQRHARVVQGLIAAKWWNLFLHVLDGFQTGNCERAADQNGP